MKSTLSGRSNGPAPWQRFVVAGEMEAGRAVKRGAQATPERVDLDTVLHGSGWLALARPLQKLWIQATLC